MKSYTVNALGEISSYTDRNGTTHELVYDNLGRLIGDRVTVLGPNVSPLYRRIDYGYNAQGMLREITTYADLIGNAHVNHVVREFNGFAQVIAEYQSHNGLVNTFVTPKVLYTYSEMNGGNHSRITSMTYPNGRTIDYNYAAGIDDTISRLTSISDASAVLEVYTYLGHNTVVERKHPQPNVDLSYIKLSGESNGDGGDKYSGLDRFNRIVDQRWRTGSTNKDRYSYGYDRISNRLFRENRLSASNSELYAYDGLDQLTSMQRGTLNASKNALVGAANYAQSWNLDAMGNSNSVTTNGVTEARVHNQQNQLTTLGTTSLTFDANGNLTTDQFGRTLVYDAWNRLTEEYNGNVLHKAYAYDGLNRRFSENAVKTYYSIDWQAIEDRNIFTGSETHMFGRRSIPMR